MEQPHVYCGGRLVDEPVPATEVRFLNGALQPLSAYRRWLLDGLVVTPAVADDFRAAWDAEQPTAAVS